MATATRLTLEDLTAVLQDERHLGWGYQTSYLLDSEQTRERLDRCVISVANDLEMTREELFTWANSKWARWLVDEATGPAEPTQKMVRRTMSRQIIDDLKKLEEMN